MKTIYKMFLLSETSIQNKWANEQEHGCDDVQTSQM